MIYDIQQRDSYVEVSYFNESGGISIAKIVPENGFQNWEITTEYDSEKSTEFRSHDGQPIKLKRGWRFYDLNLNEFLTKRIPKNYYDLIHAYNKPNFFSMDIETEIVDEFPTPEKAHLYQIYSFSITAPNLTTIVMSTKQVDEEAVQKIIDEEMLKMGRKEKFPFKHLYFQSEKTMIEYFLTKINEVFHVCGGWNFFGYDWPYIRNRCAHLDIDIAKLASPVKEMDYDNFPMHRLIVDYMLEYAQNSRKEYMESKALDYIANMELGAQKLKYEGTLKDLYHKDYVRFIAYAAIDSILVQLIHKKVKSIDTKLNQAYFNKIAHKKADGALAQSDALIFEKFYAEKKIYARRKPEHIKTSFPGAYVKEPVRTNCPYVAGYDAKSLYPTAIKCFNISFDTYKGKCQPSQVELIRSKGYVVTDRLNVYDTSKTGIYKEIQIELSDLRTMFKNVEFDLWQNVSSKIEKEAERRGLKLK